MAHAIVKGSVIGERSAIRERQLSVDLSARALSALAGAPHRVEIGLRHVCLRLARSCDGGLTPKVIVGIGSLLRVEIGNRHWPEAEPEVLACASRRLEVGRCGLVESVCPLGRQRDEIGVERGAVGVLPAAGGAANMRTRVGVGIRVVGPELVAVDVVIAGGLDQRRGASVGAVGEAVHATDVPGHQIGIVASDGLAQRVAGSRIVVAVGALIAGPARALDIAEGGEIDQVLAACRS